MKIHGYKPGDRLDIGYPVVALGFFDGVHIAHRQLIIKAVKIAKSRGERVAVFTFSSEESGLKSGSGRLYSTADKLDIISSLGVDAAIIADFASLRGLCAEEFVKGTLVRDIGAKCAVAGFNFRFGKGADANSGNLSRLMAESGGEALIMDEYKRNGTTVSATLIRELLATGGAEEAAELLGLPYFIKATVTHGRGDGRTFGFPTVNTELGGAELRHGVYRTALCASGVTYAGITNVGTCPTLGERAPHAETYILDFDDDLYGKEVKIFFLEFLRDEKQFEDKNELIMQINIDKNTVIERNKDTKWQEIGLSLP